MNYARIIDDMAVDVSNAPAEQFHPTVAAEFVEVPAAVVPGSCRVDGVWLAPEPIAFLKTVVAAPQVSPIEFKLLFTAQERVAIKTVRATDPVIDDFYDVVEDPRLTFVDLGLQSTRDAIGYLAAQGLIGAERVEQILAGVMQ